MHGDIQPSNVLLARHSVAMEAMRKDVQRRIANGNPNDMLDNVTIKEKLTEIAKEMRKVELVDLGQA